MYQQSSPDVNSAGGCSVSVVANCVVDPAGANSKGVGSAAEAIGAFSSEVVTVSIRPGFVMDAALCSASTENSSGFGFLFSSSSDFNCVALDSAATVVDIAITAAVSFELAPLFFMAFLGLAGVPWSLSFLPCFILGLLLMVF